MRWLILACMGWCCVSSGAQEIIENRSVGGQVWLRTVLTPYDKTSDASKEATYKVYTHVMDFKGKEPITKGVGGKYTHHRGMFIGWMHTKVVGQDIDTWGMESSYQQHVAWLAREDGEKSASQSEKIQWCDLKGKPFIEEIRTIQAQPGAQGARVIDFRSQLSTLAGPIELRGNVQHAGMHIRMAQEVVEHEDTTEYIAPEGAKVTKNEEASGAWWVCCSVMARDKRYWVLHMTSPDLVTGQPVYSVRQYARFGAFFEPDLKEGPPLDLKFRIVVSEKALDRAACQAMYDAYAAAK